MPSSSLRRTRPSPVARAAALALFVLAAPLVPGLGLGLSSASAANAAAVPGGPAQVVLWDTGTPLGDRLDAVDRSAWKAVPTDLLALEADPAKASSDPGYYGREYTFRGDAVVENPTLTAVFATRPGRVTVFSRRHPAIPGDSPAAAVFPGQRIADCAPLRPPGTPAGAAADARLELVRNAGDRVALAVTFGPPGASNAPTLFVLGRSEIVEMRVPAGTPGVRVSGPIEYGLLPGFIGDDLIFNPARFPDDPTLSVPAENLLVGLLGGGDRELVLTWPRGPQQVRFQLGNDSAGRRLIQAIDVETAAGTVYLGVLGAPGLWHRQELLRTHLEADVPLAWKPPFPARWKTQLYEGDVKTGFTFRQGRGQIWRGVPGSYSYPAWFEGGTAFLHPSKKVPPKDECLVYFIEGQNTPPGIPTPVDFLEATLGRAAADELVDLPGRKLRTHHRRGGEGVRRACTCGCTEAIQAVFEAGQEVDRQGEVRDALDDMIYFVARHVERIDEYRRFAEETIRHLQQAGKADPDLAPFATQLAEIAGLIPQECTVQADNMKSPQHADELARRTLALTGRKDPKNLPAYLELLKAWRDMGGAQDYVVAQCHAVTRRLFQEAGYGGVANARATRLGEEVRKRCRQVLRNPDGYEIWAEY